VKVDVERRTVDVQRMGSFQRAENTGLVKTNEVLKTYVRMMRRVIGRAWIGIPAPVSLTSCSTGLKYKCLDSMRGNYKCVAYMKQ
jgi:hypothetical protein